MNLWLVTVSATCHVCILIILTVSMIGLWEVLLVHPVWNLSMPPYLSLTKPVKNASSLQKIMVFSMVLLKRKYLAESAPLSLLHFWREGSLRSRQIFHGGFCWSYDEDLIQGWWFVSWLYSGLKQWAFKILLQTASITSIQSTS